MYLYMKNPSYEFKDLNEAFVSNYDIVSSLSFYFGQLLSYLTLTLQNDRLQHSQFRYP
jgi:hypothetical protein